MRHPRSSQTRNILWVAMLSAAALAIFPGSVHAGLASGPWPKFAHDAQNTSRSQFAGPQGPSPQIVWSHVAKGHRRAAPSVGPDGTIYLGAGRLPLSSINPANGDVIWPLTVGNAATPDRSSPAVASNGTVYIGTRGNDLWSIAQNGVLNWMFKVRADGDVSTSPSIAADGSVYFGSDALGGGWLFAANPDGSEKWFTPIGGALMNESPALSQNGSTVYVTTGGRKLAAVSAATGALLWETNLGGAPFGSRVANYSPVVGADGTIYFAARTRVIAVDPDDGAILWTFDPDVQFQSSPSLAANGTLYVGGFHGLEGIFFAISPNGTELWRKVLPIPGKFVNNQSSIGSDGKIYVSFESLLLCLNPVNGNTLWELSLPPGALSGPIIGGAGIVYASSGNRLFKIMD